MKPGELIRETRRRKGLSQRRLARRAGTSQSAIARIERGEEGVTWPRLRSIMLAMGEEPVLSSRALSARYHPDHLLQDRAMSPGARLESGLNFSRFATEVAIAGRRAKAERGDS
jgi:transcriptional regulator with XRE-family HTH domain